MSQSTQDTAWDTSGAEETVALARRLSQSWDQPMVIGLVGPLGAGKTTFVRGVVEARSGESSRVRSPTFTLINEYPGTRPPLVHADLYRAEDPEAQETIGLGEYFNDVLLLVEWADHWALGWPPRSRTILLRHRGPGERHIRRVDKPPDEVVGPPDGG